MDLGQTSVETINVIEVHENSKYFKSICVGCKKNVKSMPVLHLRVCVPYETVDGTNIWSKNYKHVVVCQKCLENGGVPEEEVRVRDSK